MRELELMGGTMGVVATFQEMLEPQVLWSSKGHCGEPRADEEGQGHVFYTIVNMDDDELSHDEV